MVMDFGDLKKIVNEHVIDKLDHKMINDVMGDINPTAENMCLWIWEALEKHGHLKGLYEIELWETENSKVSLKNPLNSELYVMTYYEDLCNEDII